MKLKTPPQLPVTATLLLQFFLNFIQAEQSQQEKARRRPQKPFQTRHVMRSDVLLKQQRQMFQQAPPKCWVHFQHTLQVHTEPPDGVLSSIF